MRAARLELQIANLRHAAGVIGRIGTPTAENPRSIRNRSYGNLHGII
jgi:hypothetical protein